MTIPKVESTVKKTISTVTFVDGVVITLEGSNTIATRKAAYIKAKSSVVVSPPVIPIKETEPSNYQEIGNGYGELRLYNQNNKNFKIKPGNYDNVDLRNLKNVNIIGNGVTLSNISGITSPNNLVIDGLSVKGSKYRAFNVNGICKDFVMKNIVLNDIQDVAINFTDKTKYNGDVNSYSENIQLLNFNCDKIAMFAAASGTIYNNQIEGLIKRFKLTGSTMINAPKMGNGIYMGCVEDYEISKNTLNNINSLQNDHNGIFHMIGNGKVFGNKLTNHQGNMLRAWFCSLTKDGYLEVYGNHVENSRRYGAFELQTPPWMEALSSFKPGKIAKFYSNNAGKLNTDNPKYFEGRLLDLYTSHCDVEIYDNTCFNNRDKEIINNMSDISNTKITRFENNIYLTL